VPRRRALSAYVDVAVLRWQNFTGLPAVLEKTGVAFPVNAGAFPLPVETQRK
jgi:hypothetical protein